MSRTMLALLIAMTAIGPFALNIIMPSLPGIAAQFEVDFGLIQLTLTLYLVGTGIAQLVYGPLSDRFGRRPVLLAGLALFCVGTLASALAPNAEILIAARMLQAMGGCAGLVLGRAMVRDTVTRDRTASILGYVTMAMVVAPMLSPIVGGHLDVLFGWRASFYASLVFGLGVLAVCFVLLKETNKNKITLPNVGSMGGAFWSLLRDRTFLGYALGTTFATCMFFSFLATAPYLVVTVMDLKPTVYGYWFLMASVGYMSGNFISGRMAERLGSDKLITLGSFVALGGVSLMIFLVSVFPLSPAVIFIPQFLLALSNGLIIANGSAAAVSVNPRLAGTASGLLGFLQMAMGGVVTYVLGNMLTGTAIPMIAGIGTCAIISVLSIWWATHRRMPDDAMPIEIPGPPGGREQPL